MWEKVATDFSKLKFYIIKMVREGLSKFYLFSKNSYEIM